MIDGSKLWNIRQLPTLPTVASRLLELVRNPETESMEIVLTMKADPATAAKLIRAANSTYFGLRHEVIGLERSVALLGSTVSNSLALSFSMSDDARPERTLCESYRACWHQSIVQSAAAGLIAKKTDPALREELSSCGLLLEIGRLALLTAFPREYLAVLDSVVEQPSLVAAEARWLEMDHAEVGATLMKHWKLPDAIAESIRLHHAPLERLVAYQGTANFNMLAAMAVSSAVGDFLCTAGKETALERLYQLTREFYHWTPGAVDDFLREVEQQSQSSSSLLNLAEFRTPIELMVQANEQLVQLTLRADVACTQALLRQQTAEQDQRNLESQYKQLQKQALHDPLTKIYNRQFFDEMLDAETKRSLRCAAPVAVIFADLDRFKQINDTYGHQFGDVVLQQASRAFGAAIRSSDILARYGGEEFVILVNRPTEKGIERLAERLRKRIEDEVFLFGEKRISVSVSLGAVIAVPGRNEQDLGHRLLATADECLYEAKRAGRNRFSIRSLIDDQERRLQHLVLQHRFSRWLVSNKLLDIPDVSRALLECRTECARIGELAQQLGFLSHEQVQKILIEQEESGERFGLIAMHLGWMTESQLVWLLSLQQEDPKQLAAATIRLEMLSADESLGALEAYREAKTPHSRKDYSRQRQTV